MWRRLNMIQPLTFGFTRDRSIGLPGESLCLTIDPSLLPSWTLLFIRCHASWVVFHPPKKRRMQRKDWWMIAKPHFHNHIANLKCCQELWWPYQAPCFIVYWGHHSVLSLLSPCRSLSVCPFLLCPAGMLRKFGLLVKGELVGCENASVCKKKTSCALRWREHVQPRGNFTFIGTWAPLTRTFLAFFFLFRGSFECDCSSPRWTSNCPVTRRTDSGAPLSCSVSMNTTSIVISRLISHYQSGAEAWPLHGPWCVETCVCLCVLGSVSRQSPQARYVTVRVLPLL